MHLRRIVPPVGLPVTLQEVKAGARIDGDEDDALIASYISAAVERVEGPDGEIQRVLLSQVWELKLDAFPGTWSCRPDFIWPADFCPKRLEIEIPLPPLRSVDSIKYIDTGGVEQTLDVDEYTVAGVGDRHRARIRPVTAWPSTDDVMEAVTVRFTAGYGDSWNDVPEVIRQAITAMVQGFFDGCENDLPEKLLRPHRADLSLA